MDNQHKKIDGYRDLSQDEISRMNHIKGIGKEVGEYIKTLEENAVLNVDKRWLAIAKTDLQKGFMSLVRAIARPTTF